MEATEIEILAKKIIQALYNNDQALTKFSDFFVKALNVGVKNNLPEFMSKNRAIKYFGRKSVDQWISKKLINVERRGNRMLLETSQLMILKEFYKK